VGLKTFCDYYNRGECRSCSEIETDYRAQLDRKEARVRESLAFLSPPELDPSVPSPRAGFRNRAKLVVTGTSADPVIGLGGEDDLDLGRALLACPIHHPKLNEVIGALPEFIREYDLVPYRIAERKGELKGLILFYASETDEMYLRFILRSKECVSRIRKLLPKLQARFPRVTVVTANLQPIPHAILEGPEEVFITERKTIRHAIGGVPFRLAPPAFVQTNSEVAAELYACAAEWIRESGAARVVELFCGQGAFSFFAAGAAAALLGIDRNVEGVEAANASAREQGLAHLRFKAASADETRGELEAFRPDLVLVNPPRRGLAGARSLLREVAPRELIYSSCHLETLVGDLQVFRDGYRVRRLRVFDLFPHTKHFEVLVWLVSVKILNDPVEI
jgi:23S rRNA (uracil747-C5)-methyltransferase